MTNSVMSEALMVDGQEVRVEAQPLVKLWQAHAGGDKWLIRKNEYERALAAIEARDPEALKKALEASAKRAG